MELSVVKLVQELEIVSPEMGRYMQESILHPESFPNIPPGMVPPGMVPGGIPHGIGGPPGIAPPTGLIPPQGMIPGMLPPGSDPMAMLQFQQMQAQMSAMQDKLNHPQKGKK